MNVQEARAKFAAEMPWVNERGVYFSGASSYLPDEYRRDHTLAMDAQPGLTTDPNSAVPAMLTTYIDPSVYEVVFAPTKAAEVLGEQRKGDWLTDTAMFPVVEHTGEVSSYGDFNENGRAGLNTNWPQRQSYLFQTIMSYGERELERAGLARINWVSGITRSATDLLTRFLNLSYLYGIAGLQSYGLTNDPNLPAALTPATKANGGVTWFTAGGSPNATANEVYNDIIALYQGLVNANQGVVDEDSALTLALSPQSAVALKFTNSFNVNVKTLLTENFQKLRIVTVPQYGVQTAANSQGIAAGNLVQLIADEVEGQDTGFAAFSEKLRTHPIIRQLSSFKQKATSGTWGAIIRMPAGFQQLIGV